MDPLTHQNISLLLNKGFEKAAQSFSKLVNRPFTFSHSSINLVRYDQKFSGVSSEAGDLTVLTTNMIGELSGKSFLILSELERTEIYRSVSPIKEMDGKLQEAILLEIDNIVSASVIAQLADDLRIEVYGDVPHLQYVRSENMQEFLSSSISPEGSSDVLLCSTTFLLDNHSHIHPQFIWKFSEKVFQMIQQTVS